MPAQAMRTARADYLLALLDDLDKNFARGALQKSRFETRTRPLNIEIDVLRGGFPRRRAPSINLSHPQEHRNT